MINSNKYADVFQTAERVSNYVTQEGQNKIFFNIQKIHSIVWTDKFKIIM